jgi:hypothetical protein
LVRRAILHIGMHKTGTTSIQSALAGYDDGSVFYGRFRNPNHSRPFQILFTPEDCLPRTLTGAAPNSCDLKRLRHHHRQTLIADLQREDRDTVLFSGEGISFLNPAAKQAAMAVLRRHVAAVEVIAYVRDPWSYARSALQQRIKNMHPGVPDSVAPEYRRRLEQFAGLADRTEVVAYQRTGLAGGSVVLDLAARLGLDPARIADRTDNPPLSFAALRLLHLLDRHGKAADHGGQRGRQRLISILSCLYPATAEAERAFGTDLADCSDCAFLRDRFGIEFAAARPPAVHAPTAQLIRDISDIDPHPLEAYLDGQGQQVAARDLLALMQALRDLAARMAASDSRAAVQGRRLAAIAAVMPRRDA